MCPDSAPLCSLAIETSSVQGSVALGRGDQWLGDLQMPRPTKHSHRRVDLMPAVDQLCRRHDVQPRDLNEVYLSIGPGSFTGLRNAVATARMFALTLQVKIVAVPTVDVVVRNAPDDCDLVAVCLNTKRDQVYAAAYRRVADGDGADGGESDWRTCLGPDVFTVAALCQAMEQPAVVLAEHLPPFDWPAGVRVLDPQLAVPRSAVVWRLGRAMAQRRQFTEPANLLPLYARPPEAVELWEKRRA